MENKESNTYSPRFAVDTKPEGFAYSPRFAVDTKPEGFA